MYPEIDLDALTQVSSSEIEFLPSP